MSANDDERNRIINELVHRSKDKEIEYLQTLRPSIQQLLNRTNTPIDVMAFVRCLMRYAASMLHGTIETEVDCYVRTPEEFAKLAYRAWIAACCDAEQIAKALQENGLDATEVLKKIAVAPSDPSKRLDLPVKRDPTDCPPEPETFQDIVNKVEVSPGSGSGGMLN